MDKVTLTSEDKIVNVQFAEHKEGEKTSYVYLKKDVTTTDVDDKFHLVLSPAVVCENGKCEINENIDELIKQVAEQEANAAAPVAEQEANAAAPVAEQEANAAAPVADQEAAETVAAAPVVVSPVADQEAALTTTESTDTALTTRGGRRTRNVRGGRKRRSTMKKRSRRSRSKRRV